MWSSSPVTAMIVRTLAGFAPGQLEAAGGTRFTSYVLAMLLTTVCLLQVWNLATLAAFWPFALRLRRSSGLACCVEDFSRIGFDRSRDG